MASHGKPQGKQHLPLPRALVRELQRTARDPDKAGKSVALLLEAERSGDDHAALREGRRAKRAAPRSATVRRSLGEAAFRLGEYHEAAQELLTYRRLTGERDLDGVIGECYRRLGRTTRALAFLSDLQRDAVSPGGWVRAQVTRARALGDAGKADVGLNILAALDPGPDAAAAEQIRAARDALGG